MKIKLTSTPTIIDEITVALGHREIQVDNENALLNDWNLNIIVCSGLSYASMSLTDDIGNYFIKIVTWSYNGGLFLLISEHNEVYAIRVDEGTKAVIKRVFCLIYDTDHLEGVDRTYTVL